MKMSKKELESRKDIKARIDELEESSMDDLKEIVKLEIENQLLREQVQEWKERYYNAKIDLAWYKKNWEDKFC